MSENPPVRRKSISLLNKLGPVNRLLNRAAMASAVIAIVPESLRVLSERSGTGGATFD